MKTRLTSHSVHTACTALFAGLVVAGLLLDTSPALAAQAAPPAATTTASGATHANDAPHRYAVVVEGLACPFCAYGIEKQIQSISGVDLVQTDIATETVTVTMKPGVVLAKAVAARAIKRAGFTMHGFRELPTGQP